MSQIVYSYERVPTIRQFAMSDARVRAIVGPFGCLPGDAEFLTPIGWKRIDEYAGELVGQWRNGNLEFVEPDEYVVKPADKWVEFSGSKYAYMKVSPEHRIPYYSRGVLKVKTAWDIKDKLGRKQIPVNFYSEGREISENKLRLLTAISADGSVWNNQICVTLRRQRKIKRLKELLSANGIFYDVRGCSNRPTEFRFIFKFEFIRKFPNAWYSLSSHSLGIILDECLKWDGGDYSKNDKRYFTTIKENADFIQYCAHATGKRAYIAEITYDKENWKTGYIVYISSKSKLPSLRKDYINTKVEEAEGNKYCFVVPSSFFIVRQNGVVYITGNSGKSSGCLWELIRRAQMQVPGRDGIRRTRWAIVRNSYPQLRDTTIKTVLDWLPERIFGQYKVATHDYLITGIQGCYIEFMFRALDNPDHIDNLLSLELTGAWLNEVKEIPVEIVDAVDGRINRYPSNREGGATWYGMVMDTNPPDDQSWFYKRFEEEQPEGWEVYKQPSGLSKDAENILTHREYEEITTNPDSDIIGGLHPDYYIDLAKGKSQDYIDVYIHGKYGLLKEGKPVYEKSYNNELHVAKNELHPILNKELIIGMDFGLTPAAVFLQLSSRGTLRVLGELVSEDMGIEGFIKSMLKPHLSMYYQSNPVLIVGDPAGVNRADTDERTCFDVLRNEGFKVKPAKSNSLAYRIGAVEYFLNKMVDGNPAFQLSPLCKVLRKGFVSGYVYKPRRGSLGYTDQPLKNMYSHPHDALQYGISHFVEDINTKRAPKRARTRQRRPASSVAGY